MCTLFTVTRRGRPLRKNCVEVRQLVPLRIPKFRRDRPETVVDGVFCSHIENMDRRTISPAQDQGRASITGKCFSSAS